MIFKEDPQIYARDLLSKTLSLLSSFTFYFYTFFCTLDPIISLHISALDSKISSNVGRVLRDAGGVEELAKFPWRDS